MTSTAASDTPAVPDKAVQAAYIDGVSPSRALLSNGIIARLPALGSIMLDRRGAWGSAPRSVGVWIAGLGKLELSAYMPDREDSIQIADGLKPYIDLPWRLVGVPLLLAALGLKVSHYAAFGPGNCRLRRLCLRLQWRFQPEAMARKLSAWKETKRADAAAYLEIKAKWEASEAARDANREAAFEAGVERRLAERLASAGA